MGQIIKATKHKLTAGRIAAFHCPKDKSRAYLWCAEVKGLGIIATAGGAKSYIFQAKVNGKSMRLTIGDVAVWNIPDAQAEARRLQILIDQGNDPRQVKAEANAERESARLAKEAAAVAIEEQAAREAVTVSMAWKEYIKSRKPKWSERHYIDHVKDMQAGGEKRKRSPKLTEPGPLAPLANIRLIDLTPEVVEAWAEEQATKRPTRARLSLRLLKAFLFWCASNPEYKALIKSNAAQSKAARESLGKPKPKNDVLQREQLPAWFDAIRQMQNPVISAYLQTLLLTGARRNELASIRWDDVDFKWNSITIKDKVEGQRIIPLTPYVANLLQALPRRNGWVFSSLTAKTGRLQEPRAAHHKACAVAGVDVTLHGLRRSFASLCEWIEVPAGISAQIQGHAPQGVREQNYIRRPLDLLRMWHVKIEAWILEQAGVEFVPVQPGLQLVKGSAAA